MRFITDACPPPTCDPGTPRPSLRPHLAGAAFAALALLLAGCDDSSTPPPPPPPPPAVSESDAASQAFTFTIPIYKFFATQRSYIAQGFVPNYFVSAPTLQDATERTVTKPNHDTLYSIAWIKLANGPLEIDTPESGSRYFSLALMDAYTNNFAVHGTRTDGGHAVRLWLVGPGWTGAAPDGTVLVQSTTNSVWALARTYTDGSADDYTAAHAVQAQLHVVTPTGTTASAFDTVDNLAPPAETDFPNYFAYVDQLMTEDPPTSDDTAYIAAGPALINVGPNLSYDPTAVDADQVSTGATTARTAALALPVAATTSGWAYATTDVGDYGTNYALRAQEAESALAALPDAEALYFIANTALATPSTPLAGATVYTLTFPANQLPPTGAFWSLTLYEGQDPSQEYFYDNPANIYAISYPASMPVSNPDGSLTLTISNVQPADVPTSNWLPAPTGTYSLQFRDYLPTQDVLDGSYVLPPLVASGS